jgi:hypothetical protein
MRMEMLTPLAAVEGVRLFSVQVGPEAGQARGVPWIVDLSWEIADMHELGALLMNLDLLVTVDTAPAHLAGALGRAVWVMLAKAADWRWLSEREDSPWYPTMRLYRQKELGEWAEVVARVREDLGREARKGK